MGIRKQAQRLTENIYSLTHEHDTFDNLDKFQELKSSINNLSILLDLHSNKFKDSVTRE